SGDRHGEFSGDIDLMRRIASETGVPISYILNQHDSEPEVWREVLAQTSAWNRDEGTTILAQTAVRPPGVLMGLTTSLHPFTMHPTFVSVADLPLQQLVEELRRPEIKAAILSEETGYYK